jgi:rhodanese-related sulfurtransferase
MAELSENRMGDRDPFSPPPESRGITDTLETARKHLQRLTPQSAHQLMHKPSPVPAVLVDIRPFHQRQEEGMIEGALVIERNVLEWRLDPRSDARLEVASRYDIRVVIFCSEGYTSSLAARSLQELGLWNATDIVGGFKAWQQAGLGAVPSTQHAWGEKAS